MSNVQLHNLIFLFLLSTVLILLSVTYWMSELNWTLNPPFQLLSLIKHISASAVCPPQTVCEILLHCWQLAVESPKNTMLSRDGPAQDVVHHNHCDLRLTSVLFSRGNQVAVKSSDDKMSLEGDNTDVLSCFFQPELTSTWDVA